MSNMILAMKGLLVLKRDVFYSISILFIFGGYYTLDITA